MSIGHHLCSPDCSNASSSPRVFTCSTLGDTRTLKVVFRAASYSHVLSESVISRLPSCTSLDLMKYSLSISSSSER